MKFIQEELSATDRAYLERAKKAASTSTCAYKHGCVAVRGGRVMAVGVNAYRNSRKLFDIVPASDRSIHAEEACLRALGGEAQGITMYVARVNRRGEERMSKPCRRCAALLRESGVKKVIYTIDSQLTL